MGNFIALRARRAGLHRGQEQQMFFWNFIAINQLVLNLLRARELCQREKCSLNLCVYVNSSKISRARAQAQDWHVIAQIIKTSAWFLEGFWPKKMATSHPVPRTVPGLQADRDQPHCRDWVHPFYFT